MRVLRSGYVPTAPQLAGHLADDLVVYLSGGYGAGKTCWLVHMALGLSKVNPGLPGLVASASYPLMRRTVLPSIVEWLPGASRWPSGRDSAGDALGPLVRGWSATHHVLTLGGWAGGAEWHFGSAEIPSSLEGANYAWAVVDEPRLWTLAAWRTVMGRIRHPKAAVRRVAVGGVPEMGWMWEELRGGNIPGRRRIPARTRDNPHLPAGYAEQLHLSGPMAAAYLDGEFVHLSGSVFSGYQPDAGSVVDLEPNPGMACDGILDFGHRRPYFGVVAELPEFGAVVVAELPGADILTQCHAEECAALCLSLGLRLRDVFCDPAGKARNAQTGIPDMEVYAAVLRRAGVLTGQMRYTTDAVERHVPNGIEALDSALLDHLGNRRIFVARRLTAVAYPAGVLGIHQSLLSLHYRDGSPADPLPVHDDASHATDALRYYAVCRWGVTSSPSLAWAGAGRDPGAEPSGRPESSSWFGDVPPAAEW